MALTEPKPRNNGKTSKYDPLMFIWKVCRCFGLAPVTFKGNRPQNLSMLWDIYGFIFICVLNSGIIVASMLDLRLDQKLKVRTRTSTSTYTWFAEVVVVISTNSVGVFGARKRMQDSIRYLQVIDKITSKIECDANKFKTTFYYVVTSVYTFTLFILHFGDLYTFIEGVFYGDKDLTVVSLLLCYSIQATMLPLLEVQFMWIAFYAYLPLELVNKTLEDILLVSEIKNTSLSILMSKDVDVDMDMLHKRTKSNFKSTTDEDSKVIAGKIRRIGILFGTTCDVIKGLNVSYGMVLVCTILKINLHNVTAPFYFILHMKSGNIHGHDMIQFIFWCYYQLTYMVMLVEPGYQIELQVEQTRTLANRLMQHTSSPKNPIAGELDLLIKQIDLNTPSYNPLRTCTLSRPFILTFITCATTYLVIVLQFQGLDKNTI